MTAYHPGSRPPGTFAVFPLPTGGGALVFERPEELLVARRPSEVAPTLCQVDAAIAAGKWVAGFLSYEAASGLDPNLATRPAGPLPLAWFGVVKEPRRDRLSAALAAVAAAAGEGPGAVGDVQLPWTPSLSAAGYAARVERIRDAIASGHTYQVNLTWRLRSPFAGSPAGLFARMLETQPVAHAALLEVERHVLCSVSPELFFRRRGDVLLCRPMKGTAARGRFPAEDAVFAAAFVASDKERAENLMIVDMVRNDLGRIARPGTVRSTRLCRPERYATLWQLTSTVSAESDAPLSAVLAALFPSASVTGAPKARTMELIAELEDDPRGAYTGAMGWAGPGGRAHFNVAIRTVWIDRDRGVAEYGTGGGVTWESAAAAELAESRLKASILLSPPPSFRLLETLRWSPRAGFFLLSSHLARLRGSARHLGFRYDGRAEGALRQLAAALQPVPQRVRLRLSRDGEATAEAEPLTALPRSADGRRRPARVGLAPWPIDRSDSLLFHKTTHRELYEAASAALPGCDDVLLWNRDGEVTESTVANLVARLDGELVTPPLSCGLLPGTYREALLSRRRIVERVVRREDLARASGLWLINSVRGCIPVELVAGGAEQRTRI